MAWYEVLLVLLGTLVVLMALGLPVVFAFFATNLVGAYVFMGGENGVIQLVRNAVDSVQSFALLPIPLFILMGEIMFYTGVAARAIDAVDKLIARVPGRLSLVAIVGGTIFSSLSGSTIANTAMLGSTLLPEMYRRGYHSSIAIGPIIAVGGIAMLIPPSALAVLLGSIAQISISELLVASIIPALILATLFFAYVIIRCWRNPQLAPPYEVARLTWRERLLPFVKYVVPLSSIFIVVVGSIIGGIATPTESAALGAAASLAAAAAYRRLTWKNFVVSVRQTLRFTVMTLFIICGSITLGRPVGGDPRRRAHANHVAARHAVHTAVSRLLHGSGEHDDDHDPAVHADRAERGFRSGLVRRADAHGAGDQPRHTALRPSAVRRQGSLAADADARHHRLGRPVHRACAQRRRAADPAARTDSLFTETDRAVERYKGAPPPCDPPTSDEL